MEGVGFNCGLPISVAEERLSFFTFFFPKGIDVLAGTVEVGIKTPISDGGLGGGSISVASAAVDFLQPEAGREQSRSLSPYSWG